MAGERGSAVEVEALGVKALADPQALDDYDLLETISIHGVGSFEAVDAICTALLGEDGWADAKEKLRDEKGKLPMTRVAQFLNEVTEQLDALKN